MRKVVDWQCEDGGASLHFRIKQMSATQAERFTFKILLLIGANGGKFEVVSAEDSVLVFTRTLPDNKVTVKAELKAPWSYEIITE